MNDNMAGVRCWGGVVGIRTKAHKNTQENTNKFPMEKILLIKLRRKKTR